MAAVTVAPSARDVSFEFNFNKSCMCCWQKVKEPKETQQVFVTSRQEVEPFKRVRTPTESRRITHERVERVIQGRLEEAALDLEEAYQRYEALRELRDLRERAAPLTVGHIRRLDTVLSLITQESPSASSRRL